MQPPDPTPPVPIGATFVVALQLIRITFDQPLVPGVFLDLNWFARFGNLERTPGVVRVVAGLPTVCTISTVVAPADIGPDLVDYTAAAPDLFGQNGLPVAAFSEPLVGV